MNNAGGQTQQGQAGQAGQAQTRPPPMYQPAQIRTLPMLSADEKANYELGVSGLWNRMNNSPANSPEHVAARKKIVEFSRMLFGKIQSRRAAMQQQGGQQASATTAAQGQPTQQLGTATQQNTSQQTPAAAAATTATNSNGAAASSAAPQAAPTNPAATMPRPKVPEHILSHVKKLNFKAPQHIAEKSPAEAAKWAEDMRDRYGRALTTMESAKAKLAAMEKVFRERTQANNPLKNDELRQFLSQKNHQTNLLSEGKKWIETVRKQQEGTQGGNYNGGAAAAQNKANGGNAAATMQQNQNANANVEGAKNQQQIAGQKRPSPASNIPTPQQKQARMAQNSTVQGGPAVKQEPQLPAPVNTALANAQAHTPAQGATRVATPQSATVAPGGPTKALSHSAAMLLANQRAAVQPANAITANQQQQPTQQPAQKPVPQQAAQPQQPVQMQQAVGIAATGAQSGTNNVGTPTVPQQQQQQPQPQPQPQQQQQQHQGHSHAHPPQQPSASLQSKMPIQKYLPERATAVPQGVTLGGGVAAGRPTLSQGGGTLGGVTNQPAMAKVPAYSHDAEGDHVLSKKKLDELVRQVCGAPSEGSDGNLLTPEVEENVLNMADSFVDNVLHAACRNAKERGSKVLEIRDLQLVLERTYNIRVPGYSSDELRTVRKVQPSPGWIAKMSAVQAAKVMPGKGE